MRQVSQQVPGPITTHFPKLGQLLSAPPSGTQSLWPTSEGGVAIPKPLPKPTSPLQSKAARKISSTWAILKGPGSSKEDFAEGFRGHELLGRV